MEEKNLSAQVAKLARLKLGEEEGKKFNEQIQKILDYVELLTEANVDGIEPMFLPNDMVLRLREDTADDAFLDENGHPKVLSSASDVFFDGFKVPKFGASS